MTAAGKTHSGSTAERAIELLAKRGVAMRSGEIADALDVSPASIAACLEAHVKAGTLLMCKVTSANNRPTNEYRISAGGAPLNFRQYKTPRTPRTGATDKIVPSMHAVPPALRELKSLRTPAAVSPAQADTPSGPMLELTDEVPNPGLRFGKEHIYRNTLLAMKGDASFVVKDATQVYPVAKKLGIKITTRKEDGRVRVWRVA